METCSVKLSCSLSLLLKGKLLRGRQTIFMIRQWFKTAEAAGAMFDLADLMKVTSRSTNNPKVLIELSYFQQNWEAVIAGMQKVPDDETLETLYKQEVSPFPQ